MAETDKLLDRMAGRFARVETRRRAGRFVCTLLADLPRKNCWSVAEHAGDADPYGMQHFLSRASWDTDGVRDDLRDYVVAHLGDSDGVLVIDETGDLKKGVHTVGVQRQYTGTAGRIENSQVAVYLAYATDRGHALIDRELYLPSSWTDDPQRMAAAGVHADVTFATKPALATGMLTRALRAGVPARWATGDEVYGADPDLRAELEAQQVGYVLAIGCDRRIPTAAGLIRADELAASLSRRAWHHIAKLERRGLGDHVDECDLEWLRKLFPQLTGVTIEDIERTPDRVLITPTAAEPQASCPRCGTMSARAHSRYQRQVADAPIGGIPVVIELAVRRMFWVSACCPQRSFAEQVPGLTSRYARRSLVLGRMLAMVGLALAGRPWARLGVGLGLGLGLPTSRSTLLQVIAGQLDPPVGTVILLSVGDFVLRRGRVYGTVLIDIDTGRPVVSCHRGAG